MSQLSRPTDHLRLMNEKLSCKSSKIIVNCFVYPWKLPDIYVCTYIYIYLVIPVTYVYICIYIGMHAYIYIPFCFNHKNLYAEVQDYVFSAEVLKTGCKLQIPSVL